MTKLLSNRTNVRLFISFICAALFLSLISSCSTAAQSEQETKAITASEYMINMSDLASKLSDKLNEFSTAVSEEKISAMQTKLQEAKEIINEISELEAPEGMTDLKDKYNSAISQLNDTLDSYSQLFTEIYDGKNASGVSSANTQDYSQKIEDIQKSYDSALGALEDADKLASEK